MGEFTNGGTPTDDAAAIKDKANGMDVSGNEDGFETDVSGCMADDEVTVGTEKFPVFDVDHNEFYQNMRYGRKRLRFNKDSKAGSYLRGTRYRRPFYVRHTDAAGKKFVRKIDK